jgi:hypothetical protein
VPPPERDPSSVPDVFVLADWIDEEEPATGAWADSEASEREWRHLRARQRWRAAQRGAAVPRSRSDAELVAEFMRERAAGKWARGGPDDGR